MNFDDWFRLVNPRVGQFSVPAGTGFSFREKPEA
jgi:hypothetical protein